jgi:TP901 family phage tail tape measure protein
MGFPQIGLESVFKDAGFNKAMKAYTDSVNGAKDMTDTAGKSMTQTFTDIVGGLAKVGLAAGALVMTAAIGAFTALGKAAWEAGTAVDDAMDSIIIKTGATGQALSDMQDSFERTLSHSASNAKDVGEAVGEVARQFGLTGEDLAEFSLQVLDVTRMMGGDVTTNVKDLAQAMKAFNIPTEEAVPIMEAVFVASQKSGVAFDELLKSVKTYASPMKSLKFSFKESVAMIAKWTSQGLNADKMIMSLRLGIANIVDPAKDADAALEDMGAVTGDIREKFDAAVLAIKGAKDETEAMNIGMTIFGKRGGADLVTAIREGKLTAEDFTMAMDDASGAIERTFQATADWPELLQMAKNKITVALEPIGAGLLSVAKIALESFMPVFEDKIVPFLNTYAVPAFKAITDAMLLLIQGDFAGAIDKLLPSEVIERWKNFSPILGGLAGVVKTALQGLMGANIWEDTTTIGLKGVTVTPGLKSQMIALGGEILKWIGQGLIDAARWATSAEALAGITRVANDIVTGLIDAMVASLKTPENTAKTGQGIIDSVDVSVESVGTQLGKSGWKLAGAILKGIWEGLASEIVRKETSDALALKLGLTPPTQEEWDNVVKTPTTLHASVAPGQAGIFWGEIWAGAQDFFKGQWTAIELLYLDARDDFIRMGTDISNDFTLMFTDIGNDFARLGSNIWDWLIKTGTDIAAGLGEVAITITTKADEINAAIRKPFEDAWAFIQTIPGLISGIFANLKIHIPMPHLSTGISKNEIIPGSGLYWPTFNVNWYAQGLDKIFNAPTLIGVGESGPERVSVMPLRGGEPGRMSSPAGSMGGGGGGDHYWVLNITTSAPTENILNDYRLLASMGGAA